MDSRTTCAWLLIVASGTATGAPLAAQVTPDAGRLAASELPLREVQVDGVQRSCRIYLPERPVDTPGLIVALHGSSGDADQARSAVGAELEGIAEREGYLVAYPNGLGGWNGCMRGSRDPASVNDVNDVGFIEALIEDLVMAHGVDRGKIFALGYSGGGHMVYRLALERPRLMTASAAMVQTLPAQGSMSCEPSGEPVSILIMNGTADRAVRFEGGPLSSEDASEPGVAKRSTVDTFEYWAGLLDDPHGPPTVRMLPDIVPEDESTVEVRTVSSPRHEVMLAIVHGGGHSIPGTRPPPGPPRPQNRDVNGVELAWQFFARRLPGR